MIIYESEGWLQVVFKYVGTVWPHIFWPMALWAMFAAVSFAFCERTSSHLGSAGHTILGGTMSFLLVFRANQSYIRYWQGRTCLSNFFAHMRDFLMLAMLHCPGGKQTATWLSGREDEIAAAVEDSSDVRGREFRVNLVRLVIAYAVMLKTYTRIAFDGYCFGSISFDTKWLLDWDRLRLRQLLKDDEFRMADSCLGLLDTAEHDNTVDGLAAQFRKRCDLGPPESWPDVFDVKLQPATRMQVTVLFYMIELLMNNTNDMANTVPWGIKERFLPSLMKVLHQAQFQLDMVGQIITTPLALPYACLCKTLLSVWMMSFPFMLDYELGFFGGAVIPVLVVFALLGIDAIATELENPFGDDANDLDILECIHTLESEAMELLELTGDFKGRDQFVWRRVPAFVAEQSCKPIRQHLAVASLAVGEVVPSGSVTPASSHRSSRSSSVIRSASASEASYG